MGCTSESNLVPPPVQASPFAASKRKHDTTGLMIVSEILEQLVVPTPILSEPAA